MVLGGRGVSASVPAGQPLGDGSQAPGHPPNSFANNWGWFDDVSDGPVTAVVKVAGQPDQQVAKSAWVIVAPPDYAPYTNGITTLYDIALQAANISPPQRPSFQNDILPIIKAASGLRWVSALLIWQSISTDYATLSTKGTAPADKLRKDTLSLLLGIQGSSLQNYHLTANQKAVLTAWANGDFVSDFNPSPPQEPLTPPGLDRASLTQAVGGGFFPGIEAGIRNTSPDMYSSPFRITDKPFTFAGVSANPSRGVHHAHYGLPLAVGLLRVRHAKRDVGLVAGATTDRCLRRQRLGPGRLDGPPSRSSGFGGQVLDAWVHRKAGRSGSTPLRTRA